MPGIRFPSNPVTNFAKLWGLGPEFPGSSMFKFEGRAAENVLSRVLPKSKKAATVASTAGKTEVKKIGSTTLITRGPKPAPGSITRVTDNLLTKKTLTTGAKVGAVAGAGYIGYKGITGVGGAIDRYFETGSPYVPGPGSGGSGGYDPSIIPPGAAPPGWTPSGWNGEWQGSGGPGGGFWGNLGSGLGGLPGGAGQGIQAIGEGIGGNIVTLAAVAGVVVAFLAYEQDKKKKRGGKK